MSWLMKDITRHFFKKKNDIVQCTERTDFTNEAILHHYSLFVF